MNLTNRKRDPLFGGDKFASLIDRSEWAIETLLLEPVFPSEPNETVTPLGFNPPRTHLGSLAVLPSEIVDLIILRVDSSFDVISLSAAHHLLSPHCFMRLIQIFREETNRVWWCGCRIALVGDYLRNPPPTLLPEDLRADLLKASVRPEDADGPDDERVNMSLSTFASTFNFERTDTDLECYFEQQFNRKFYGSGRDYYISRTPSNVWSSVDQTRVYRALHDATPDVPQHIKSPVLLNLTKCQMVRPEYLERVDLWGDGSEHLSLGAAAMFLVACTDDWSFTSWWESDMSQLELRGGGIIGRWAGDRLAIVPLEDVEEGYEDISEEVVELAVRYFSYEH